MPDEKETELIEKLNVLDCVENNIEKTQFYYCLKFLLESANFYWFVSNYSS